MPITQLDWLRGLGNGDKDDRSGTEANLSADKAELATSIFHCVEDKAVFLRTAQWDSAEQYQAWMQSPEHQQVSTINKVGGMEPVTSFLVDHPIFAATEEPGRVALLDSPVISVGRISVEPNNKQEFIKNWNENKGILESFNHPYLVRTAWRLDPEADTEEFLIICGWPAVQKHGEFAQSPDFPKYAIPLKGLSKGFDIKHYERSV